MDWDSLTSVGNNKVFQRGRRISIDNPYEILPIVKREAMAVALDTSNNLKLSSKAKLNAVAAATVAATKKEGVPGPNETVAEVVSEPITSDWGHSLSDEVEGIEIVESSAAPQPTNGGGSSKSNTAATEAATKAVVAAANLESLTKDFFALHKPRLTLEAAASKPLTVEAFSNLTPEGRKEFLRSLKTVTINGSKEKQVNNYKAYLATNKH